MADQKQDKDYTDAELTKMLRESMKQQPAYIRKHIDINRIRAVNATGQNPADYASSDQKDAVNNKDAIADVRDGSRTVVHIYRPSEFVKDPDQITGHEGIHFIQNGLPDGELQKFAPVNPKDPYSYGGNAGVAADAKAGKPIESLSAEQQAALSQYQIAFDKFADKPTSPNGDGVPTAAQQDWENNRDNYKHYTDQIAKWPQKPYDDDKEPIVKDDDPRLKVNMNLQPDAPPAGTIPAAQPAPVTNVATGSFQAGMLFGPGDSAPGEAPSAITPPPGLVLGSTVAAPPPSQPSSSITPPPGLVLGGTAGSPPPSAAASAITPPPGLILGSASGAAPSGSQPTAQSPVNGQPASNPNESILDQGKDTLKKAWNWANTPLTESLGGMADSRAGAGGFERGLEKVASGFTSPLSIALTLGTFGTAGFIESAGASVLRDVAGMSAAEIADVAKGADAITQATKTGTNYAEAIQASGADPAVVKKGLDALYAAGLKEGDLTGGNAAERGASLMFRKFALTPAKAQVAAKTMQLAVNAGFTYQAVQQAAQMSPRALDALKEGDYDHFAEYATEALAGAAFGAAGATHAIHSAGELAEPLLENKLRPSDETRKFSNLHDALDGQKQTINEQAQLLEDSMMDKLGYKNPKYHPLLSKDVQDAQSLRLNQMYHYITLGGDDDLRVQYFNALAEGAGRPDRLPTQSPENGQVDLSSDVPKTISEDQAKELRYRAYADQFSGKPPLDKEAYLKNLNITGDHVIASVPLDQVRNFSAKSTAFKTEEYAKRTTPFPPVHAEISGKNDGTVVVRDGNHRVDAAKLRGDTSISVMMPKDQFDRFLQQNGQTNAEANGTGTGSVLPGATDGNVQAAPPNPALPSNLRDLIANSDLKNKPADYVDHLLDIYRAPYSEFTDTEKDVAKGLRNKLDSGFEDAHANGLIKNYIEDYLTRRWEKPNPTANRIISDAGIGRFATDVSMARQRTYQSELEPLLKGYKLRSENPLTLTSQWLANTYSAIANRKFEAAVLDHGIKASSGMPAAVLLGSGQVVEGGNGENAATFVRHDAVRNIAIADQEVQNLKTSGSLDRFLDDGTIRDITPKVYPDTIPAFIDRLERIGQSQTPKYDEQGNNILRQQIDTLKDIQAGKRPMADLALVNDAQKPVYIWDPQAYERIDQPSMRDWNYVAHDPTGNPVLLKGDLAVHKEYADYFKTRLGLDESGLQKWASTRALLKGGSGAKKLLLSFSPFHLNQLALRGVMMGVDPNPWNLSRHTIEDSPLIDPTDPLKGTILRKMVDHRLTLHGDYKAVQEESEGVAGESKILSKIPIIGKAMTAFQEFLFKKYLPALKSDAAIKMFNEYKDAHPDWTDDRVAEVASAHVNDTFGGINWRSMGRSAATQDWARLMFLAPDWLESEVRSFTRLFGGSESNIGRAQIAKMALYLWGTARVLNYATTGNFHNEAPFGLAVKTKDGKEIVYSLRTLPTDLLHAATDPIGFMKGRFSPALQEGQELYSGRDHFGRKLSPGDMAVDLTRNLLPIPGQALGQAITGGGPEVGNTGQLVKAFGGTAQVYRTEAQKLAAQIASDHSESGPVDPALLHRHRVIMNFEDKVRDGEMSLPQVYQMVVSGDLSQADAKKITENAKITRGMPADMASLYTRSSRLPPKDFLQVWDISTPQEKTALAPLMIKNRKSYVKKAMTDETPQERQRDPVLHRFMTMFPQATPF